MMGWLHPKDQNRVSEFLYYVSLWPTTFVGEANVLVEANTVSEQEIMAQMAYSVPKSAGNC
jgi:hypothetical protein